MRRIAPPAGSHGIPDSTADNADCNVTRDFGPEFDGVDIHKDLRHTRRSIGADQIGVDVAFRVAQNATANGDVRNNLPHCQQRNVQCSGGE